LTWKTLLVICLIVPFAGAFLYAALHEYRRHRREGPVEDWRDRFEFDEEAPGFEHPDAETGTGDEDDQTDAGARTADATQDRKG